MGQDPNTEMRIFPAIDLYEGKAVRLLKGDYNALTVYSENPIEIATTPSLISAPTAILSP